MGLYTTLQLVTSLTTKQTESAKLAEENVLSENVVESVTIQKQSGSFLVSIPKGTAQDFGISKGDSVLFVGEEGDHTDSRKG